MALIEQGFDVGVRDLAGWTAQQWAEYYAEDMHFRPEEMFKRGAAKVILDSLVERVAQGTIAE